MLLCRTMPLGQDVELVVLPAPQWQLTSAQQQEVESIWADGQSRRQAKLFNGKLLMYARHDSHCIYGSFTDYKTYFAYQRQPQLFAPQQIRPLAVSGITLVGDSVLLATRSDSVSQYPGYLELVPSGNIDDTFMTPTGHIDFRQQILQELQEEAGILPEQVVSLKPVALIADEQELIYDVCLELHVQSAPELVIEGIALRHEYINPILVSLRELPKFLAGHKAHLVPTSFSLLMHCLTLNRLNT
jgi:hypothetical protein